MVAGSIRCIIVFIALAFCTAQAAVTARVDRADIELNESFTLEIVSDRIIDAQPDVAVLDTDFYVGQGSQLSNTTIVNGQIQRSKTWTYVLMPKRTGEIVIPPISVGNEQSQRVVVNVKEPSYAPPGQADVFVTSEVDFEEAFVQAQVLLTIKIYRAVATRQPALREPTISGVEALTELAGDDRSYEAVIDGRPYNVVERVYAIYPQESGKIEISSARFEARVLRDGRITGRKVYDSEPRSVNVLPVPAPPADHPDAVWLPARELSLTEDWSRSAAEIKAGEPLTRHVTISALGQLETQIPALEPPSADGINVYPDKPELSRTVEAGGIRGVRKDQYAMIGVQAGTVTLPALEVPWWNTTKAAWEVARLPERNIRILPSGEAPAAEPDVAEPDVAAASDAGEPPLEFLPRNFWRRLSELLGAVWLLTLFAWWWSTRPPKRRREPAPAPLHKQQARHLRAARKAAQAGDAAGVRKALLDWAALQWRDDAPRSIGAIAQRVSSPLAEELTKLSNASYGPNGNDWSGDELEKALRSTVVPKEKPARSKQELPPLMPAG